MMQRARFWYEKFVSPRHITERPSSIERHEEIADASKSWNKVYSMRRYPLMNNNGCQIYFILLPNLLV